MRYYNQATGENRIIPDDYDNTFEKDTIEKDTIVSETSRIQTIIPKEGKSRNNHNNNFFNLFGIERIDFSNLNLNYIINHLEFDDLLLIGLIILLLSDWTEDDIYLVLILVLILISEWIIVPTEEKGFFAA